MTERLQKPTQVKESLWSWLKHCAIAALLLCQSSYAQPSLPAPMPSKALPSNAVISTVALGSCFVPQFEAHQVFDAIAATKPDIFLFLGDNVYQSDETHEMDVPYLKAAYGLLGQSKPFAHLRKTTTVLPTWDDHDFGMNDAGSSYKPKYNSEALFEHVWAMDKNTAVTKRPGIYYAKTVGPKGKRLQIIMLDTRFFRSDLTRAKKGNPQKKKFLPNHEKTSTMLGKDQWQWFENQLTQPADLRIIVSSVQVLSGAGWSEGWYLFPHEQARFTKLIHQHDNILLVSGDRHYANFYQHQAQTGKSVIEFTSSSLNLPISGDFKEKVLNMKEPYQQDKPIMPANFGLLQIDWSSKNLSMEILDDNGKILRAKVVSFAK